MLLEYNNLTGVVLGKDHFNPYTDVQPIIAVDWDGTILLDECKIDFGLLNWLRDCQKYGAYIILYTCRRSNDFELSGYLKILKEKGYEFDSVNEHHPRLIDAYGESTNSKIFAHWYIDDQSVMWSSSKMYHSSWKDVILNKVKNYSKGIKYWYYNDYNTKN